MSGLANHLILTTAMSIMEGKKDVLAECRAKLGTTLQARYCFMLPAAAINFSVVPSAYRVAFQGMVTFIWVNVLCYYKVCSSSTQLNDSSIARGSTWTTTPLSSTRFTRRAAASLWFLVSATATVPLG